MHRRAAIAVGVLVLSGTAEACGSKPADVLQGKSAAEVVQSAMAGATRLGAVHYVLQTTSGGASQKVTGDASAAEGAQYIVSGPDQTVIQLIGSTLFVRGNASGLQDTIGLSAAAVSTFQGRWVTFRPGDAVYQSFAPEMTLRSVLAHLTPAGVLSESTPGVVGGHQVVGIRGDTAQSAHKGTATLYVTTAAPTVPVDSSKQTTVSGQTVIEVGAFSKWGERVKLKAPSGALPYTSAKGN